MVDREFYEVIVDALSHDTDLTKTAALEEKSFHDLDIFECIKEAAATPEMLRGVGKKLLTSAGITAPVAAGGGYLINQTAQAKEEATKGVLDRAMQTALGVGGVGAGLLGLHHVLQKQRAASTPQQQTTDAVPTEEWTGLMPTYADQSDYYKTSADDKNTPGIPPGAMDPNKTLNQQIPDPLPLKYKPELPKEQKPQTMETKFSAVEQDLLQKLSTVGFLDSILEPLEKEADAKELRLLNAEYGVDILKNLLG